MGQADRELSGAGAVRVVQRGSAAATYHETGNSLLRFLLVEAARVTVRALRLRPSMFLSTCPFPRRDDVDKVVLLLRLPLLQHVLFG